jgi:GNAT superfamily N-acetyltransferase
MVEVREIHCGKTASGAAALLELRLRWHSEVDIAEFVDADLRPAGYRLVGTFDPGADVALSVLGFRQAASTAWGRYLYIDDLSTVAAARGRGHADVLLGWAIAEARRLGCEAVHLDSGVGSERAAAHRLYMRRHLNITAHHFELQL